MYAVVAMGGVFGAAAQAPLTSIASVVEMTGNFTLTVPVMLVTGIAAALSKHLSYGSIYTTKLLRRGIDIERPRATGVLQTLTVRDVMQPAVVRDGNGHAPSLDHDGVAADGGGRGSWETLIGPVVDIRKPQALFADETLEQALRQLVLYGHSGLPVVAHDGERLLGWISRKNVLDAIAQRLGSSTREIEAGAKAAEYGADGDAALHAPTAPLRGFDLVELTIGPDSPALGRRLGEISWPPGCRVVAVTEGREVMAPRRDIALRVGERVVLLSPVDAPPEAASRAGQR
jgi:chloride channel protein, CIC family